MSQMLAHEGEVVFRRDDDAAGPLHGFGDEGADRLRAFAQDGLFQGAGCGLADGLAVTHVAGIAIGIGGGNVEEAGHAGLEHGPVAGQARGAHGRQRDAVIGALAGDDLDLVRLAQPSPVVAHGLEGALVGLCAAGCEEGGVQAGVGPPCQRVGQLDGGDVAGPGVAGAVGEGGHLLLGDVGQFLYAVADQHVPQAGQPVDDLAPVDGAQPDAVPGLEDEGRLVGAGMVQRVQHVRLVLFEQSLCGHRVLP